MQEQLIEYKLKINELIKNYYFSVSYNQMENVYYPH